jgi:hypothetical protein
MGIITLAWQTVGLALLVSIGAGLMDRRAAERDEARRQAANEEQQAVVG